MLLDGLNTKEMQDKLMMSDISNLQQSNMSLVSGYQPRGRQADSKLKMTSKFNGQDTRYRSQSSPRTNLSKAEEIKTYVSGLKLVVGNSN